MDDYDVPADSESDLHMNKSDLLSAIVAASMLAKENPDAMVELLLASDGWFISYGLDAASGVPSSDQVLGRLEAVGVTWDLSAFSEITACGFHNQGATAAKAQARGQLWRDLLRAGGGPELTIRSSCEGLYPDLPRKLAPQQEDSPEWFTEAAEDSM